MAGGSATQNADAAPASNRASALTLRTAGLRPSERKRGRRGCLSNPPVFVGAPARNADSTDQLTVHRDERPPAEHHKAASPMVRASIKSVMLFSSTSAHPAGARSQAPRPARDFGESPALRRGKGHQCA